MAASYKEKLLLPKSKQPFIHTGRGRDRLLGEQPPVLRNKIHRFLIILLHFTIVCAFVVAYLYYICVVEILYDGVLLHISSQSNIGSSIWPTMGIFMP